MSRPSEAQAYYIPDMGIVVKTERVNNCKYVVHFEDGPERVDFNEEIKNKWRFISSWDKYIDAKVLPVS